MSNISDQSLDLAILANFVHQVINPLNGVSGTLDNLADGTISQARSKQRLQAARAQLEQAIVLVRNLAYFSEMSAWGDGSLPPNHAKNVCNVSSIIIQAAMFFQELGTSKHISINLENAEDQFFIEGNPDLLRQVFMNLFDNGVKYGQRNSQLTVRTWPQKKTGALLVRVLGRSFFIPPDDRARVFELGFRSQDAKSQLASGSGLGLYICRRILALFDNSTIEVESSPNGDVAFLLRFPVLKTRR